MWPFKKKPKQPASLPPGEIRFTQLDITETFGDNLHLTEDDWVETSPLNERVPDPVAKGLPPLGADDETTYSIAERMSRIRESIQIPTDGVYCPTCHIANTTSVRLRTACPKCGKPLLKFGWD